MGRPLLAPPFKGGEVVEAPLKRRGGVEVPLKGERLELSTFPITGDEVEGVDTLESG